MAKYKWQWRNGENNIEIMSNNQWQWRHQCGGINNGEMK
jgi:hypothetical protein